MFTDEKGYLITQMVWEEVSDSEASLAPQVEVVPKKMLQDSKSVSDKSKVKIASAGQKSMTSFFQKKK